MARNGRGDTYTVERGDRHKLIGIEFAGNKYFDTELLRSRITCIRRHWVARKIQQAADRGGPRFDGGTVPIERILDVNVDAQILDNYLGKEGDLFVRFVVNEGIQTRVASLKIEGNRAFTDEELQGVVGSLPGQPYSEVSVGSDRANILALYFNQGYPEAALRPTAEEVDSKKEEPAATQLQWKRMARRRRQNSRKSM